MLLSQQEGSQLEIRYLAGFYGKSEPSCAKLRGPREGLPVRSSLAPVPDALSVPQAAVHNGLPCNTSHRAYTQRRSRPRLIHWRVRSKMARRADPQTAEGGRVAGAEGNNLTRWVARVRRRCASWRATPSGRAQRERSRPGVMGARQRG